MISRLPVVNPPMAPPMALPKVPVMMSTRPRAFRNSIDPRPVLPMNPCGVAFVHHDHGLVRVGEVADLVDLGHVAVHGKHAVGDDHNVTCAVGARFLQALLQLLHVVVGVAVSLRLAQPNPVDDGSVVQAVADDGVLL